MIAHRAGDRVVLGVEGHVGGSPIDFVPSSVPTKLKKSATAFGHTSSTLPCLGQSEMGNNGSHSLS